MMTVSDDPNCGSIHWWL